jgi:exoribonuclease R
MDYHSVHQPSDHTDIFQWLAPDKPTYINNRALEGDIITHKDGQVTSIVKRKIHRIVGVLQIEGTKIVDRTPKGTPVYNFIPLSWRYPKFRVPSNVVRNWRSAHGPRNMYIVIEFKEWTVKQQYPWGNIITLIGEVSDEKAQDLAILQKNQIYTKPFNRLDVERDVNKVRNVSKVTFQDVIVIDPEGSTDFDDGFSLRDKEIVVHIADVDHYIPSSSLLESEIRKRLLTIYADNQIYHMIPEYYSTNICSLNRICPKAVISVHLSRDNLEFKGFSLDYVKVCHQLTYDKAQEIMSCGKSELANTLREISYTLKETDTHEIVSKLMIRCNEIAAEYLSQAGTPFSRYLCIENTPAVYTTKHRGHVGLGLSEYTHFTSPIRRYADLIVHRLIKAHLNCQPVPYSQSQLEEIAREINTYALNVRRYYRDRDILKLYRFLHENNGIYTTEARIMEDTCTRFLSVYLPEFDMNYRYPLLSRNLISYEAIFKDGYLEIYSTGFIQRFDLFITHKVELFSRSDEIRLNHRVVMYLKDLDLQ